MFYDKIADGFFGLCVGDALGLPVDCRSREYLKGNPVVDLEGFGTYNQADGTWSDSSSLTFCAAEALISGFSFETLAEKFILWHDTGFWTPSGEVIGKWNIASKVVEALRNRYSGNHPAEEPAGDTNFPVLWMLPFAYVLYKLPVPKRMKTIKELIGFIRPDPVEEIGSAFYLEVAISLLSGTPIRDSVLATQEVISNYYKGYEELSRFGSLLGGKIVSLTEKDVHAANDMVPFITAVIWTLLQNNGYRESVLRAVNLGEDTDCLGAAVGGLAGIAYGFDSIPDEWVTKLARREDISKLISRFAEKMKAWDTKKMKKTTNQEHSSV